jgi:hypothetical protein
VSGVAGLEASGRPLPSTLLIELPHREIGGKPNPPPFPPSPLTALMRGAHDLRLTAVVDVSGQCTAWEDLERIRDLARSKGIRLHMDG